jgi:hypothetical protein
LRNLQSYRAVIGTAMREHRLVEVIGALRSVELQHGLLHFRRLHRAEPDDCIVNEAQPQIAVLRHEGIEIGCGFPAIRTIIIGELDQGDVGTGGAHPGDAGQSGQRQF